jgi:ribA/ribD-fused uncharacterized protein
MGKMVNVVKSSVCKTAASGYVGSTPTLPTINNASVTQLVEWLPEEEMVGGSIPSGCTKQKGFMQVETDDIVLFWHNDSVFSNWYTPVTFKLFDKEFHNSEAAFIYLKALVFDDEKIANKILQSGVQDPYIVKDLGRKIKNFSSDVWDEQKFNCMYNACSAKFSQNALLEKILLDTGDKILAEASPYDLIWGIGLAPNDPKALIQSNWTGENLLGKALMEVRSTLKID